jgi:hypothetical protein
MGITEKWCDRCVEEPARFIRERWALCETCAAWHDARALVRTTWQGVAFDRAFRAWEAR